MAVKGLHPSADSLAVQQNVDWCQNVWKRYGLPIAPTSMTPPDGKACGVWGAVAMPFCIKLAANGSQIEATGGDTSMAQAWQNILDHLKRVEAVLDPPKSANAAPKQVGGARNTFLEIWAETLGDGEIKGDKSLP